ncbi:PD-(D/E)XK nuclease family protein [Candidatus Parcubacteria bacterium]|nr:MAG: PD-(D/E)XK nuclease family protein [Candidatus Parcubacteria bacterium]
MRTSYSALETYKLCPRKYQFQELERIKAPKPPAAIFGTLVHKTLQYLFSRDPLFPTLDETISYFRANWPPYEKFPLADSERALYQEAGEQMLRNFYAKNPPWNFSVVDLESHFEVLIEDPRRKDTHVLAGRIDRIDKTEDGFEVIDYKTNRKLPSQAAVDSNLQLAVYSLGLARRWPHVAPEQVTLSLYFLKHGEKLSTRRTAEANEGTRDQILGTIAEIQGGIASAKPFEPVPGAWCATCPYQKQCPAWKHLYRASAAARPDQAAMDAAIREYFDLLKSQRKATARMAELKGEIADYMAREGFDRVFGDEGVLARSVQKRFAYDFERVRAILEPLGKWDAVLAADEKRLKALLADLPAEAREAIAAARLPLREYTVISASLKRVPKPEAVDSPLDAAEA